MKELDDLELIYLNKMLGFGQVLWDLTVFVDFQFLKDLEIDVGGHRIVDVETIDGILEKLKKQDKQVIKNSGGSCANVMSNMAKLGSQTAFCGKHGDDVDGWKYMNILSNEGVKTHSIVDKENSTGQLLSLITPDKDRTFIVYRGASEVLLPDHVDKELLHMSDVVHVEGYLIINSDEALWKIFEEANKITFDLAAYAIIENTRPVLQKMMKKHPPMILFSNLSEGQAFTQKEKPEDILDAMLEFSENSVLTLGKDGVMIKKENGEEHFEAAIKTDPLDTTGAGDSFSAGFLHEFLKNCDIKKASQLGVRTASATITKVGARSFHPRQLDEIIT
ncbi:MAG: adenosine kinase [Candidatus Heimdallarchaeota archaeon]|nr:adenosine kinase [Candidatus Heimdallarchaeota archaeon]MBY8993163.1 adenosine kinase [Candidatus Heimdallarchaeota archaeon]